MRIMKSSKYWYYLLVVAPFVNIANYRAGELFGLLLMVVPLFLFVLTGKRRHSINNYEKTVWHLSLSSIIVISIGIAFSIAYSIDNFYFYRFYCLSFFLLPIFFIWGNSECFIHDKLLGLLKYYIVLISSSIVLGALLKAFGLDSLEPMYDVELYTYLTRPFGIFGQPSVNSCLLCFFYLFHRSATKLFSDSYLLGKDWLFFVVTLGVIFQGSGSGFISYTFVLLAKFSGKNYKIPWFRICLISILTIIVLYQIVLSGVIDKISIEYIEYLMDFVNDDLIYPYKKMIKNTAFLLWGVPEFPLSIDLGPLFMLGTIGLVMTTFIFLFLIYMLNKTNSLDMKIGFLSLIVGNLHYPVMFYMIMHFMWYIIIYYVLVIEKKMAYCIKTRRLE